MEDQLEVSVKNSELGHYGCRVRPCLKKLEASEMVQWLRALSI